VQTQSKLAFVAASAFSLFTACGGGGGASAVTSSAEGKYIYPKSNVMVVVDVQKFFASKIWTDQIKPVVDADPNAKKAMEESVKEVGFDATKDLKTIFFSGDTDNDDAMGAVLVGASSFNAANFVTKMKEKNKDAQIEALGANAVFGTPEGKAENMAELKKGLGVDGSPDIKPLWDAVDKSGVVTVVVSLKGKKIAGEIPEPTMGKAVAAMVSVNVTDGVAAKITLRFSSADEANAAKTLADTQLKNPQMGMISGFLTITTSASGNDLILDAKATKEQIALGVNMAKGFLSMMAPKPMPDMPAPAGDPAAPGAAPANP
jgi:hypothetical protein